MCSLRGSIMNLPQRLEWIISFFLPWISLSARWDDLQGLTSSYHGSLPLFLDSIYSAHLPEHTLWYFDCCSIYSIQTHGDSQTDLYCGWKLAFSRNRFGQRKFFKDLCKEIKYNNTWENSFSCNERIQAVIYWNGLFSKGEYNDRRGRVRTARLTTYLELSLKENWASQVLNMLYVYISGKVNL